MSREAQRSLSSSLEGRSLAAACVSPVPDVQAGLLGAWGPGPPSAREQFPLSCADDKGLDL